MTLNILYYTKPVRSDEPCELDFNSLSQRHNTMAECVDNPRQTLLTKISIRF